MEKQVKPITEKEIRPVINNKMSEDYTFNKKLKCRDCRTRFRSKSRIRQCPVCSSYNIKKLSSNGWCERVYCLIMLPIVVFFALIGAM